MASLKTKLARLPPLGGSRPEPAAAAPASPARGAILDELRERIARMTGRPATPAPRADPTKGELPFFVEETDDGPLYVRRRRAAPASRVGRFPLVAARDADPAMIALLALDPSLAACDPTRALYLDTETTGLGGGTGTVAFLVGLAFFDASSAAWIVEQLLLRRLGEEAPILKRVAERLAGASMIVTYNGKAFDAPLLRARCVMNRMPPLPERPHLDLVHVARRVHGARLSSRTLVAIESEVLGRARIGDVSGGDIVATYAHFLRTGDEAALDGVVEHNEADVLSMVALVGLYGEPLGDASAGEGAYVSPGLDASDLVGAARTMLRAGDGARAAAIIDEAVSRGGGARAVRARGDIAKARGDKARALLDYASIVDDVDDPAVRLDLAKLYEHHVKAYEAALALVERGTHERDDAREKRRARLHKKLGRSR